MCLSESHVTLRSIKSGRNKRYIWCLELFFCYRQRGQWSKGAGQCKKSAWKIIQHLFTNFIVRTFVTTAPHENARLSSGSVLFIEIKQWDWVWQIYRMYPGRSLRTVIEWVIRNAKKRAADPRGDGATTWAHFRSNGRSMLRIGKSGEIAGHCPRLVYILTNWAKNIAAVVTCT